MFECPRNFDTSGIKEGSMSTVIWAKVGLKSFRRNLTPAIFCISPLICLSALDEKNSSLPPQRFGIAEKSFPTG